jgi:hypothetical protein
MVSRSRPAKRFVLIYLLRGGRTWLVCRLELLVNDSLICDSTEAANTQEAEIQFRLVSNFYV